MKSFALLLPLLFASPAPTGPQGYRTDGSIDVEVRTSDDQFFVTLRADNAPLDQVLTKLASEVGYSLDGLADARRPTLITVDLEWRKLETVLEYVLGSVGMSYRLRTGSITVISADSEEKDQAELLQLAGLSYLIALRDHPDHPLAAGARLSQGEVAELQGYPGAAIEHYQALIEDYPRALEVPEAYMRSGLVQKRLGNWADAAEQFSALANIELAREFAVPSRLELARCKVEIGDPQSALYLLSALDASHPPADAEAEARRSLVRGLALSKTGKFLEALRVLETAEGALRDEDRVEGLRVRALALQGAGNPGDAGRAWLLYALETQEPTRAFALENAVKLALEDEDELGALFIVRQAEQLGHQLRFAPYKTIAYQRLGLATDVSAAPLGMADRVSAAEAALEAADFSEATGLLSNYLAGSSALDPDLRVRFAIAWARCVEYAQGLDVALAHLRDTRAALGGADKLQLRARLDVSAAALLESHEMYDEAADAYRGIY